MMKCPYCHFDNEDGALFCDQCKSDLSSVVPAAVPVEVVPVEVVVEAVPVLAEPVEVVPMTAEPIVAEAVVPAMDIEVIEAAPVVAEPVMAEPVPVAPAVPAEPMPASHAPSAPAVPLPAGAQPKLVVMRGVKRNVEYPIYEGQNFVGRADEKPVDIDLEEQEPADRIWCSRQHCCIFFENNELSIEDLNSSNGTFVNRTRIYPGQKVALAAGDVIQIGNVQMKVVV